MGSNINPDEIRGFLQNLHPPTYGYDQASYFGSDNEPRWTPSVTGSDLTTDVDYSQYDDAQSEYRTASTVTSQAYTMRSAAPPSIFSSRHGAESSVGGSTVPSLGGPRVPFAGQFDTLGTTPRRPGQILWCEFARLKNCTATFALDDDYRWIQHHADHLTDSFPSQLMCWFCDHVPFVAQHRGDAFANFEERMMHVREHILGDHRLTIRDMRRDLHMVRHLFESGLLSPEEYNAAMKYDETPAAYRLPNSHSSSSSSNAPLGYQYAAPRESGQYHDLVKEERHRRREKQGHGHKRR